MLPVPWGEWTRVECICREVLGCDRKTVSQRRSTRFSILPISILAACAQKRGDVSAVLIACRTFDSANTAGDRCGRNIRWTNLTKRESPTAWHQCQHCHSVARRSCGRRWPWETHRAAMISSNTSPRLLDQYESSANPVLSMDTKKKEPLGPYFRPWFAVRPRRMCRCTTTTSRGRGRVVTVSTI